LLSKAVTCKRLKRGKTDTLATVSNAGQRIDITAFRSASAVVARRRSHGEHGLSLLRRFCPYAFQQLGQLGPVLLNSRHLRLGLLALVIKSCELLSGGRQLGLELGQISNCHLLLGSLGQELVLTGFQLGQLRAKIRERPPANQDQGAQSKAEHPVRVQPPCHAHPNYPPQQHDRPSSVSG
jgi:hypothetical protein